MMIGLFRSSVKLGTQLKVSSSVIKQLLDVKNNYVKPTKKTSKLIIKFMYLN